MSRVVVLDASVALRAMIPSEAGHEAARDALADLVEAGVEPVAPDVFPYEVGNAIRRAGGAAKDRVALLIDTLQLVRLVRPSVDALCSAQAAPGRLSFYDAAYVALAEELDAHVWTDDEAILRAEPERAIGTRDVARLKR